MSFKKISFQESLGKNVVEAGRCVGCGTCVLVCPFNCLEYKSGTPNLVLECKACGICPQACPQNEWVQSKAESFVFGRERQSAEEFGVYRRLFVAKATSDAVQKVCQDGGVATAILLFGLENGLIDGAVVSGVSKDKPLYPMPKLATTHKEIFESAGTRYCYSPNILALAEAVKQKKSNIAFVGTPCQIRAVRKMQLSGLKKYTAPIKFLIGLMCSECFNYEGLIEKYIHGALGINPSSIKKMNIKGKMLITIESEVKAIPLTDIKQYARKSCGFCNDFSSELADISVGGLGLDGWTFTIIRTERGDEIFSNAVKAGVLMIRDANEEPNALNLLSRLSKKKRQTQSF
ncbi:MAG: Coenzyme F420 hydrogenase/dehydrogenase, beta subunit C-terminal domain [Candidatus Bathyarchaeia archaeon]